MNPDHPYSGLPDYAYWRRSISQVAPPDVDPVTEVKFGITPEDKICTAGSCFAQHIAERLKTNGFGYLVTERAHPLLSGEEAKAFNYGVFSARYGNIYTPRQLVQLFERIDGRLLPVDDVWRGDGNFIDPFRPQIQPDGFSSLAEYRKDREKHFAAVRRALVELDFFVFTLGLTEAWRDRRDGCVYPLAPGVAGGKFDPVIHEFHNFTVAEVVEDLRKALSLLRAMNPRSKVILTVSPVPLMATAEPHHVLLSTIYSKSVLRVACEEVSRGDPTISYFPSFEIITGNYSRGVYFGADCRSVTTAGVDHVMRLFFKHYAGLDTPVTADAGKPEKPSFDQHTKEMEELAKVNCDEEALDRD